MYDNDILEPRCALCNAAVTLNKYGSCEYCEEQHGESFRRETLLFKRWAYESQRAEVRADVRIAVYEQAPMALIWNRKDSAWLVAQRIIERDLMHLPGEEPLPF